MITDKLAYILWQDRIKEEERVGFSLGSTESDWIRAEKIINFFESPRRDNWEWYSQLDDNIRYAKIYEELKSGIKKDS